MKENKGKNLTEEKKEKKEEVVVDQKVKDDFLEVLYYQTKQRDSLLGEFAADGSYQIKDEKIKASLLKIPKILQDKQDGVAYASIKVGPTFLNFKVEFDISESYCSAHLYIIEIEHKLDESIKHVQELDSVVEIYSPLFVENVFKLWNIVRIPVELEKDDYIVKYLQTLERNKDFMKELSDILSQIYVIRMLQVLAGCGELGQKVVEQYNEILAQMLKKDPTFAMNNLNLKMLLDKIIIKNGAFEIVMKNGGQEVMKGFVDPINRLRGKEPTVINVEVPEKKKETNAGEKKSGKKSGSASKSASSGGGSSKGKGKGKGKGGDKKGGDKNNKKEDNKKKEPFVFIPAEKSGKNKTESKAPNTVKKDRKPEDSTNREGSNLSDEELDKLFEGKDDISLDDLLMKEDDKESEFQLSELSSDSIELNNELSNEKKEEIKLESLDETINSELIK